MPRKVLACVAALLVFFRAGLAIAEPYEQKPGETLHIKTPGTLFTEGGSVVLTLPGHYYDDIGHGKLDTEMRRLQEAETRLKAENDSLRKSAKGVSFGWVVLGTALAAGITTGYLLAK